MTNFLKVAVALSGGIDSAVAALLLKNRGYDVIGTFIKYWDPSDEDAKTMQTDLEDTRWLCRKLKIPLEEIDLVNEHWRNVYTNIIADYNIGYVPNADIIYNEHITFGCYHRYCLDKLNADAIATGHFAKSSFGAFLQHYKPDQFPSLLKSADVANDQTYILSRISRKAFQRTMFPIGELTKTELKNIARQHSLDKILQKEISDICFMNSQHYKTFLSRYVVDNPGRLLHVDSGEVVGKHQGLHHWPIGQCYPPNHYVVGNDEKNIIFVASSKDHPAIYCRSLTLSDCHWIREELKDKFFHATFQYSNDKTLVNGNFVELLDYPEGGYVFLESETPLYAVTPGQYVVLYNGNECLGSMKIMNTGPSDMFHLNDIDSRSDEINKRLLSNLVVNK